MPRCQTATAMEIQILPSSLLAVASWILYFNSERHLVSNYIDLCQSYLCRDVQNAPTCRPQAQHSSPQKTVKGFRPWGNKEIKQSWWSVIVMIPVAIDAPDPFVYSVSTVNEVGIQMLKPVFLSIGLCQVLIPVFTVCPLSVMSRSRSWKPVFFGTVSLAGLGLTHVFPLHLCARTQITQNNNLRKLTWWPRVMLPGPTQLLLHQLLLSTPW